MILSESAAKKFSHKMIFSVQIPLSVKSNILATQEAYTIGFSNPANNPDFDKYGIIRIGKSVKRSSQLLLQKRGQYLVPYRVSNGVIRDVRFELYQSADELEANGKVPQYLSEMRKYYMGLEEKRKLEEFNELDEPERTQYKKEYESNKKKGLDRLASMNEDLYARIVIDLDTYSDLKTTDKITHFAGGKGVVGAIIPDDQMLRTQDGRVVDIILSPLSVISRMTTSVIFAGSLALVCEEFWKQLKLRSEGKDHIDDKVLTEVAKGLWWYKDKVKSLDDIWDEFKDDNTVRVKVATFDDHYTNANINELAKMLNLSFDQVLFDPKINKNIVRPIRCGIVDFYRLHFFAEDKVYSFGVDKYSNPMNRHYQLPQATIDKYGYGEARTDISRGQKIDEMSSWVLTSTANEELIEHIYRGQDNSKSQSKLMANLTMLGLTLNYRRDPSEGTEVTDNTK